MELLGIEATDLIRKDYEGKLLRRAGRKSECCEAEAETSKAGNKPERQARNKPDRQPHRQAAATAPTAKIYSRFRI